MPDIHTPFKGNEMNIQRVLFYSASKARGVIAGVNDANDLFDIKVIPPGSFAEDWTAITALS